MASTARSASDVSVVPKVQSAITSWHSIQSSCPVIFPPDPADDGLANCVSGRLFADGTMWVGASTKKQSVAIIEHAMLRSTAPPPFLDGAVWRVERGKKGNRVLCENYSQAGCER